MPPVYPTGDQGFLNLGGSLVDADRERFVWYKEPPALWQGVKQKEVPMDGGGF